MYEDGVKIEIKGTEYYLVMNVLAYKQICDKYKSIENIGRILAREGDAEILAQNPTETLAEVIEIFANEGAETLRDAGEEATPTITKEQIMRRVLPKQIPLLTPLVMEAVRKGIAMEGAPDEGGEETRDLVLEEIEAEKNA